MTPSPAVSVAPIAFCTAALSLVTIHLCWWLASWQGMIDWCNPYWADCVSISKTGRQGVAYFVFKGGIIPTCVLQGLVWQLSRQWLTSLGSSGGKALPWLGWAAAAALVVYTLSLGHAGDTFRLLRRFGVVMYIALSFFCFVACAAGLIRSPLQRAGRAMLGYSLFTLAVAIFSLILDGLLGETYNRVENAFEWWLLMMLNLQLFALAALWQRSQFRLTFSSNPHPRAK
ncbi:hypothetical protein NCG89_09175 [Spongiibacter taiwanensis]|uniref:hypothetical protein n=1 Tax=Spongiibacter taiwanensis TaxID=1748242 RepID=UPI00203509D1|nr:hypothetical protein [Spongiibacter taiwanensis]USA41691.1 hypothetical protein NCG89_09175 [Spongiibacter taiwanensis]